MDFRLLGPFEVDDGGRRVSIGSGKRLGLLAILLIEYNRIVPSERLMELLWDSERHDAGNLNNLLHQHIAAVRGRLGDRQAERLRRRANGYILCVAPDELDVLQFESLLARGRDALRRSDPATAAEKLTAGLGLWRGTPLTELPSYPFALDARRRWEQMWLDALQDWAEATIALQQYATVIERLEEPATRFPTRERLCAHLVRALYCDGRQEDALRRLRDLVARLRDEHGLEPSPHLAALEKAILVHDPSLWGGAQPPQSPTVAGAVVAKHNGGRSHDLPLSGERVVIGRGPDCDLQIDDDIHVSRHHACLERRGGDWYVRDMGSTNGTLVNGRPVEGEMQLAHEDVLSVGDTRLVLRDLAKGAPGRRPTLRLER